MKECRIKWFIENYSYCWHENGEELVSPDFTGLDSVWFLELYPGGCADDKHIPVFLNRKKAIIEKGDFSLNCNLSILAEDGSTFKSNVFKEMIIEEDEWVGDGKFVQIRELLHKKAQCLPRDTLSVCCTMWEGEGIIQQVKEITIRTRIEIEHICFLHVIENFAELEPIQKKTLQIQSSSEKKLVLSSNLYLSDNSCCDGKIMVEITPSNSKKIVSICKIFALDSSGNAIKMGEADNRFDAVLKKICKTPLSLKKQEILKKESEYLSGNKLSLLIECIFSTGVEYQKVEKIVHEVPFAALNHISSTEPEKDINVEKFAKCQTALDDLKEIYSNQIFTDVEIKTKTKSFPVHKNIICARSSVFKSMLTNNMKEKITSCIQIDDLEDQIVEQFLLFLYSDSLENLQWESAIKLYYAGDKYAIEKLKVMCSSFLKDNIDSSKASELLLIADTHNDSDLKKYVENYIFKHKTQVFGSKEWRNLIKINPVLVSTTMCQEYIENS